MFKRLLSRPANLILAGILFSLASTAAFAQSTNGSITIQTMDATKALLPGTHLVLRDNDTGITREGTTLSSGAFTFEALPPSNYHLSVEHAGFTTVTYDRILVQAGVATPLNILMKVGSPTQEVNVSAVSVPVIDVSSNTLSTSLNLEEVNNLPVANRSLIGLQALSPGFASTSGNGTGTFNGTPQSAYQASVDGINATSSRGKAGAGSGDAVTLRVENIQEFTVQSGELPPSQGGGQSSVQTLFVTRRGANKFHGSAFENHQDQSFNAFPWNASFQTIRLPKPHIVKNDFGGAIGGPIFKDKLFFFVSYSQFLQPGTLTNSATVPNASALAGKYNYCNASSPTGGCTVSTIDVLQGAKTAGLDGNVNPAITYQEALNEPSYKFGTLLTPSVTQLNTQTIQFQTPAPSTTYYPAFRVDYTISKKLQANLSFNMTRSTSLGRFPAFLPGPFFQAKDSGSFGKSYVAALGIDYTVTPNLLNQVKVGYLYTGSGFSPEAAGFDVGSQGSLNYPFQGITSGNWAIVPQGSFYPYLQLNDDLTWQKGAHTIKAGGNIWHQQDHFYNAAAGPLTISLGLSDGADPAFTPIQNLVPTAKGDPNLPGNLNGAQGDVRAMYAWLNGRVSSANRRLPLNAATKAYGPPGTYNLDEASLGGGFYAQDSWRVRPDLTFNYGLRWDLISDQHDVKNGYTGPSVADLFGPSGVFNIFQPGANSGPQNPQYTTSGHKYHSNLVLPQPQIGFAWNPSMSDGFLGKVFGAGKTVIRASYTIKNYTEGGQNFWAYASNSGFNFFQTFATSESSTAAPQFFAPGTVHLVAPTSPCTDPVPSCVDVASAGALPPLIAPISTYQTTIPESQVFFNHPGDSPAAIDPNIKQPYVESYTFGIQRQIGRSSAVEVRYVGNRTIHDWIAFNYNEINGLNNGFLQDFVNAQKNLATNIAAGKGNDFTPYPGDLPTPILSAAFALNTTLSQGFQNGSFVTALNNGSLGALAAGVANSEKFFCNVVGQGFGPCATAKLGPASSSFPANLFQVNPYLEGTGATLLSSTGSSNYNSLQVEFRQKVSYGLNLNANYTYGKTLGISSNEASGSIQNAASVFTLHNLRLNYIPISYDIRNALKLSATYALPFGKDRAFLSHGRLLNYAVGGWTAGVINIYQTGSPILITGGLTSTINSASDGGVSFVGTTTARDIQKSVHVTPAAPHNAFVNLIDPKFQGASTANPAYLAPNKTPGVEGNLNYIYGPKWNNFDLSATKDLPIFEAVHINLQGIFLNAFNHPEWTGGGFSTQSSTFGTTSGLAQGARRIELRGNITF
jgi:Carboxypeptidase regulatory-like domain